MNRRSNKMRPYIKKVLKPVAVEPNEHHRGITYRIYRINVKDLPDDKEVEIVVEIHKGNVNHKGDPVSHNVLITTDQSPF